MNNEKKIMVSIKSAHFTPNENYIKNISVVDPFAPERFDAVDAQRIDVDYAGTLSTRDGRLIIRYEESELTGMLGATTEVSFDLSDPSIVMMQRTGVVKTSFCFEEGARIECVQETGEFALSFVVDTAAMSNGLGTDGGDLKISYAMEVRGNLVQRSLMHLTVSLA